MAARGAKPKPTLQVVREGNPGKRPIREGVRLPPADLVEPDWIETFPDVSDELLHVQSERCRRIASQEWRRIVPLLSRTAGLSVVDATIVADYCVCVARLDQAERDVTRNGTYMDGHRGPVRNPSSVNATAYRTQIKAYIGELGLSPSARVRLPGQPEGDDGGDVFD